MLLILCLLTPSPKGAVRTQQQLGRQISAKWWWWGCFPLHYRSQVLQHLHLFVSWKLGTFLYIPKDLPTAHKDVRWGTEESNTEIESKRCLEILWVLQHFSLSIVTEILISTIQAGYSVSWDITVYVCARLCVFGCTWLGMYTCVSMWRPKDNLRCPFSGAGSPWTTAAAAHVCLGS